MNHFRPYFIHENLERSFSCIPTCIESFDDNQGCDSKLLLIMQGKFLGFLGSNSEHHYKYAIRVRYH